VETETYRTVYFVLIQSAFCIAFLTWLGYTILAPWNKYTIGRLMWLLLLSITLVLFVPFLQATFGNIMPFRREVSVVAMVLFNLSLLFCGYGIYTKQIKGYLKSQAHFKKIKESVRRERKY
jgi:hypothetical protein